MKKCPIMSYRDEHIREVVCFGKDCAIFHKCQEKYTLIDIADEKYDSKKDADLGMKDEEWWGIVAREINTERARIKHTICWEGILVTTEYGHGYLIRDEIWKKLFPKDKNDIPKKKEEPKP